MDFCPRFRARGRMFRPMMIVRLVEPLAGTTGRAIPPAPATSRYGATAPQVVRGSHHLAFAAAAPRTSALTTNASLSAIVEESALRRGSPPLALRARARTRRSTSRRCRWRRHSSWKPASTGDDWVRSLAIPFEWQEAVIRAAISLKLCTYEDTGAVLAALTTSIPEARGTGATGTTATAGCATATS